MNYPYLLPKIDLNKIVQKEYFYKLKTDFLSNHVQFKGQESPDVDLKEDNVMVFNEAYENSNIITMPDGTYNYFLHYLIPSLPTARLSFIEKLNSEIKTIHDLNGRITPDFFFDKIEDIKLLMDQTSRNREFIKKGFKRLLKSTYEEVIGDIETLERHWFPKSKIHLNLNKTETLLFLHSLYENEVIVGCSIAELSTFAQDHITFKKDSKHENLKDVRDSLAEYLPAAKSGIPRKKPLLTSKNKLIDISKNLHEYFKSIKAGK